jgi:hypothetical protein
MRNSPDYGKDMSTQLTNVLDEVVARKKADALKKELLKPVAERRKPEEVINSVMDDWLFTTATGTQLDPSNLRKSSTRCSLRPN